MYLLRMYKKDPSEEWLSQLEHMSKTMELKFYTQAKSREEYSDPLTLNKRVLAMVEEYQKEWTSTLDDLSKRISEFYYDPETTTVVKKRRGTKLSFTIQPHNII